MAKPKRPGPESVAPAAAAKPFYFLSYSTGEPQIKLFAECLQIVFGSYFDLKQTPASLAAGEGQHDAIIGQIKSCAFGVVCLDGLRPNVTYEYGALRGANKAVLIFKEASAEVDIKHFYGGVASLGVGPPAIDLDKHFSDSKDRFCETWSRFEIKQTVKKIWDAYNKAQASISGYVAIPEPKL